MCTTFCGSQSSEIFSCTLQRTPLWERTAKRWMFESSTYLNIFSREAWSKIQVGNNVRFSGSFYRLGLGLFFHHKSLTMELVAYADHHSVASPILCAQGRYKLLDCWSRLKTLVYRLCPYTSHWWFWLLLQEPPLRRVLNRFIISVSFL